MAGLSSLETCNDVASDEPERAALGNIVAIILCEGEDLREARDVLTSRALTGRRCLPFLDDSIIERTY